MINEDELSALLIENVTLQVVEPHIYSVLNDEDIGNEYDTQFGLIKQTGKVPENLVFLHADALHLPFREEAFETILSENLLHCLKIFFDS